MCNIEYLCVRIERNREKEKWEREALNGIMDAMWRLTFAHSMEKMNVCRADHEKKNWFVTRMTFALSLGVVVYVRV